MEPAASVQWERVWGQWEMVWGRMPLSSIFSIDDRFRTRSLSTLLTANFDGEKFQGVLTDLEPGVGYEVFVAKDLTFNYAIYNRSADWLQ